MRSQCHFFSALLALAACTAPHVAVQHERPTPRAGDPALDGQDYLLVESDFRSIISAARDFVRIHEPRYTVRRVHVLGADRVEIYLGPVDEFGEPGHMRVERRHGTWQVIGEIYLRVIVTDLTRRWSQPLAAALLHLS